MLILTRRTGEAIWIGKDVQITVISHHGNQVRIGIDAPRNIPVLRAELLKPIQPACAQIAALPTEKVS